MEDTIEYVEQSYLWSQLLAFIMQSMIKDGLSILKETNAAFAVKAPIDVEYLALLGFLMLNIWGHKSQLILFTTNGQKKGLGITIYG